MSHTHEQYAASNDEQYVQDTHSNTVETPVSPHLMEVVRAALCNRLSETQLEEAAKVIESICENTGCSASGIIALGEFIEEAFEF